ncbi:unnamed protein product [Vitrella brassicaformis CCMP3155]|uniref:Uncharacterized protein n=1 Tax=Vitrella brassicaformis (strain CCMP3155) TaxID=1169540 RepID=A0A0G4H5A2_VITBC|nr:unnamed protein product [Vitrella brassicaformis CCMP3155]|eukprot:CEM38966.1 unnamed protein product [Vitrella brassicaformis CCMP3155]
MRSVASRFVSDLDGAERMISLQTDSDTQDGVSIADSLAAIRNTLIDAHSALTKNLARIGGKAFRWDGNAYDSEAAGGAVTSNKTTTDHTDPWRCLLAVTRASPGYGDPCLSGLPKEVFNHIGSFVTTKTSARLAKVNRDILTTATDETWGLFRHFTVMEDEQDSYSKIRDVKTEMQHMGKVKSASVRASDVGSLVVLSKCLSFRTTLEELTLDVAAHFASMSHIRRHRWSFPALNTLRVSEDVFDVGFHRGLASQAAFESLLNGSPGIEHLEGDHRIELDDDHWADFLAALGRCPNLNTITGLVIPIHRNNVTGRLNQLKAALNRHWGTPEKKEVPKKLGFVVENATIDGATASREHVKCRLDWWPARRPLLIDCSTMAATAPPAPGGLYGEIATRLAANATEIKLMLGGTALHESWRDKLIFSNARTLTIDIKAGASVSEVVDSIPEWLTEREGEGQGRAADISRLSRN